MCYINARSVNNKTLFLQDYIYSNQYDIFAISETWLNCEYTNDLHINALLPPGYKIFHIDRENNERAGGVALIYKQSIKIRFKEITKQSQFEHLKCTLYLKSINIDIIVVYRPPPSQTNRFTAANFFDEWIVFLSEISISKSELIIVGDFNFHLEIAHLHNTKRFNDALSSHGLQQHIMCPTHYLGHALDALISRENSSLLNNINVRNIFMCTNNGNLVQDHFAIVWNIKHEKVPTKIKTVTYRNYKHIDDFTFKHDIVNSKLLNNTGGSLQQLTDRYEKGIVQLLDKHAPYITRSLTVKPETPWYNAALDDAKRVKRKKERIWRRSKKVEDLVAFKKQNVNMIKQLSAIKKEYYSTKIEDSTGDTKALFRIANGLLESQQQSVPFHEDATDLANKFANFFKDKITLLRENLESTNDTVNYNDDRMRVELQMTQLEPTNCKEVHDVIMSCSNKTCELDPIPTFLLKRYIEELIPLLTCIMSTSMTTGVFPQDFKKAIIRPHLKKASADINDLKGYRPVSNLSFLSKVLEKLIYRRVQNHMELNHLYDAFQSAYRLAHSTETALVKINNDILKAIDVNESIVLVSLDLSAAFDTVDHSIFINRLEQYFGVTQFVKKWFSSYLTQRESQVCINGKYSQTHTVTAGVPQGSVLGALLYTIYILPLTSIIRKHGLSYHTYADDTQVYIRCNNSELSLRHAINKLELCISDMSVWLSSNTLKLNEQKTELIIFRKHPCNINKLSLKIGESTITESDTIRLLGVIFDNRMNLEKHIANTCKKAFMHIRKIKSIRSYLTDNAAKTLMQATVISNLDYCNSLLIGLPQKSIKKLQLAHNTAARVITNTPRHDHITGVLAFLHWLPISKRSEFKILVMTYKALQEVAPAYICELLEWYVPARNLRSASTTSLVPSRHRTIRTGKRIFDNSAAVLWNALPNTIKTAPNVSTFKKHLKTFLFSM